MVDVLYVEDNANDADIFNRLMRKLNRPISFTILTTGSEAVEYLTGQGRYENQPTALPKLLLLDLNLTGLSGVEVMEHIRSNERTRFIPIVAFSTSDSPTDIRSAYEAGVNAYVVKPGSYPATGLLLSRLYDFWLQDNTRTHYR
ncbi:response regulator [Spirosoma taeanense]|uniref:Response regulator n=1 Tax=Spirosoma taeanense TaxID=2735870 RepID=A0A6M5Y0A8_9BACT|nr:response regulator [Spirosoma taeanense]QJW88217.1 response regulator [Spirosoma taeanense]